LVVLVLSIDSVMCEEEEPKSLLVGVSGEGFENGVVTKITVGKSSY
jgi:hypothetical protein